MTNVKQPPIPLSAPNGEVLAFACSHCLQIRANGSTLGPPCAETRAELAESSRLNAGSCCLCGDCGALLDDRCYGRCANCEAKESPQRIAAEQAREAADESESAQWIYRATFALKAFTDDWPLTIVGARDGFGYAAFPMEYADIPTELTERVDATHWVCLHGSDLFGLADTPEAALTDLRTKAANIKKVT